VIFIWQLLYHLDPVWFKHQTLTQNPPYCCFDIDSSTAAVPVDFFGLCIKLAQTHSRSYSAVNGQPLDFCLHNTHFSKLFIPCTNGLAYFAQKAHCTVTTDLLMIFQHTKRLLPRSGHFLTTYTHIT
jgi:hypothetical protein